MNYLERVKPTYIENWPNSLKSLSFADVDVPLSLAEARALGTNIIELGEGFVPKTPEQEAQLEASYTSAHAAMFSKLSGGPKVKVVKPPRIEWQPSDISGIISRLDEAVNRFPNGAFVRLGSRSPKDAFWRGESFKVNSGKEAAELLCATSERMYEDLLLALKYDYTPHIFVRQWLDMPKWQEFRCFMRGRRLVGISQYHYRDTFPEISERESTLRFGIEQFFNEFRDKCHLDDVVFDVWVKLLDAGNETAVEAKLIEINPLFEMTDPCLFDWHHPEQFDGSFRFNRFEKHHTRLMGLSERKRIVIDLSLQHNPPC